MPDVRPNVLINLPHFRIRGARFQDKQKRSGFSVRGCCNRGAEQSRIKGPMNQKQLKLLTGARKAPLPEFIPPQLATLVDKPPAGDAWFHELKLDGYRLVCHLERGSVRSEERRVGKAGRYLCLTTLYVEVVQNYWRRKSLDTIAH